MSNEERINIAKRNKEIIENNIRPAYMSDEEFLEYTWNSFTKEFLYPLLAAIGTVATVLLIIARFL